MCTVQAWGGDVSDEEFGGCGDIKEGCEMVGRHVDNMICEIRTEK